MARFAVAALFIAATVAVATHSSPSPRVPTTAVAAEAAAPAAPVQLPPIPPAPVTTLPPPPPPPATSAVPAAPAPAAPRPQVPRPRPQPTPPVPPPTVAPAPRLPVVALQPPAVAAGAEPYRGLGTWIDVYDWSYTYTNGQPHVTPDVVDRIADAGVQTLYIQASKHDAPTDVLEPDLLQAYIDRAGARGLRVVTWYLPTLVDPGRDLQRLLAVASLGNVHGLAVDIEARIVADVNERNRRLVELSTALRRALPGRTIGAIVLPPVFLEEVSPGFWPAFPYAEIAPSYDVWMTMGYWTNRTSASGYRDAYRYTTENVGRLRAHLGRPDLPVHPIGGIGDRTSDQDVAGYVRAAAETASIGGSLYDWRTTRPEQWPRLNGLRA